MTFSINVEHRRNFCFGNDDGLKMEEIISQKAFSFCLLCFSSSISLSLEGLFFLTLQFSHLYFSAPHPTSSKHVGGSIICLDKSHFSCTDLKQYFKSIFAAVLTEYRLDINHLDVLLVYSYINPFILIFSSSKYLVHATKKFQGQLLPFSIFFIFFFCFPFFASQYTSSSSLTF